MISTHVLKRSLLDLGYRPADVLQDYRFAALDEPGYAVRQVDVAAFLDSLARFARQQRGAEIGRAAAAAVLRRGRLHGDRREREGGKEEAERHDGLGKGPALNGV